MARQEAVRGDARVALRLLQMEGQAREAVAQGREEGGRRLPVRGVPRQIPEPWLPLAQRQGQARPRAHHVRPIRPPVLQIRRHQVEKQALRLQKARGAEEDLPQHGDGLHEAGRPYAGRGLRHDGVLGRREVLGAHALHGSLGQRDRRVFPLLQEGRPEHILRRPQDGRGEEKRNGRPESSLAHGPRQRLFLEGLQRAPSPLSYHPFDVPRGDADRQRGDGGDQRMGQGRNVHRLRHRGQPRCPEGRRGVHRLFQRGPALIRARLPHSQAVQGKVRREARPAQEAKQAGLREEAGGHREVQGRGGRPKS